MVQPMSNLTLGRRALELECAIVLIGDEMIALATNTTSPYGPIVGVRCGSNVQAVAYPISARLVQSGVQETTIAVVVTRENLAQIVSLSKPTPLNVEAELGPAIDVGRRALGLVTPEELTSATEVLDIFWLDSIISVTLRLGTTEPLNWASISMLHPLVNQESSPQQIRERRETVKLSWRDFRHRASNPRSPWPGMDPAIASWLDDGSFARWCISDLPEKETLLEDLQDLLEPQLMTQINEALDTPGDWIRRWL